MAKSAMEIGAGSTLVTYAGICDDDNIQMRSDPYFHVYNLNEFQENYFQSTDTDMQTCGTSTVIPNERPTANVPATCAIPKNTPFFLQGLGTDPNAADVLAYTWEQVDPAEFAESMSIGFKKGPLFRSVSPSASGFLRNFPNMTAAIVPKGWETPWPGERLPFTARDIHFAMTVRDNYMAAKPTLASQDLSYGSWHAAITKVNVVDLGPMLVEQPAAGASVPAGITLVTFKLDGYKNPVASTGLDDVKGAKFTFEVTTNGGLAWTNLVRSQNLVKLNDKGEGSAHVVLPTSLVGSTVAQIRVVADMAKVPGRTTTGCAFWAPSGRFTVTAARSVPTVATTNPAATPTVPAEIAQISFGFSAPVFQTPTPRSATPVATTVKVVVVGAGTSGLAAARTLIDTWDTAANGGPLELTVLEAGTRIGGRVWTLNAAEAGAAWDTAGALGAPTDMGASWIHGSNESHPITKIATALGLAENAGLVKTRNSLAELHLCTNGDQTTACPESNDDQYTAYKSLLAQAQQIADQQMGAVNGADISLWQALSGLSSSGQTRDSDLFQYNLASSAEFQTSGPVVNLSAVYWNDDSKYNGAELVWAQGYKVMYEALQSGAVRVNDGSSTLQVTGPPPPPPVCSDQINSGVLLEGGNPAPCSLFAPGRAFNSACSSRPEARQNCPVSCGTCPPPSPPPPPFRRPISVTYNKRVTSVTYNSTGVVLTTADSSTYNADYVIITIPLGVLKSSDASSSVTFSPALPPATANGISQLGFGNVVKIALLFPTAWWVPAYGATPMHYYALAQAGTNRGLFTYFLNVHALANKPVLMTFALGAAADTAEGMSNADVWTQVRSPSLLQHTSYASSAWV